MCRRVDCSKCGKPTFAGCGAHVEQVLRDVPVSDRCDCQQKTDKPSSASPSSSASWLSALFGR
mgnify:CR=1 FL=1